MVNLEKSFIYRIQEGDDFKTLFQKFNTCFENVFRNNSEIPLYSGEVVEIQQNNYITHIVKPMETLDGICKTYNLESEYIINTNDLQTKKLFIGQMIKIFK